MAVRCAGCNREAVLDDGKLRAAWHTENGKAYCPLCWPLPMSPGYHSMSILPIAHNEFNVTCDNHTCDFNVTKPTRSLARSAAFDHLKQLLAQEGGQVAPDRVE